MRKVWWNMLGVLSVLLAQSGCKNESLLRPPKNPEEYRLPPTDQRYVDPPQPPKETLNQDPGKKNTDPGAPSSGSRTGGRMGGQ